MAAQTQELTDIGLEAALILTNNFEEALVYEKMAEYIFNELSRIINLNQITLYVIDEEMENLKEEAIYGISGLMPSYDVISLTDLSADLARRKVVSFAYKDFYYTNIPLETGSRLLGLIKLRTYSNLEQEIISGIKDMAKTISLGLRSVLFESDTIREKENTEFSIKINNRLQSIDKLDLLINTFLKMTAE